MATQVNAGETETSAATSSCPPGASLGIKDSSLVALTRKLKRGLPFQTLVRFQKTSQLSWDAITKVVQIPQRTLARRKLQGKLTAQESERLLRLALIFEKATDLFEGDAIAAGQWLSADNKALASQSPLTMADTEIGAREVESLIGRLEHGVFS